jgi:hypothetical protein
MALFLVIALLLWSTGFPTWLPQANAVALTTLSDTLSDSDVSVASDHALAFTTTSALDASDTIVISLDPSTTAFTVNNLGASDFTATTSLSVVSACGAGTNEVTVSTTTEIVTLTVCASDTIAAGAIAFTMDNTKITNPTAGSYVVRIQTTNNGSTVRDQGDARVYIIDDVVLTASVDSTFTFTITGVANGASVNGSATTTSTTTTSVLLPFETLVPNVSKVLAQDLAVITNAANGFTVTIIEDQNPLSSTGADIDLFINGATTSSPTAWTTPTNTLGQENTYGHIGITSEDDLNSNEFGTSLWVGNFAPGAAPRAIFHHNAPADGVTANQGATRIGFQIEIDSLQQAATDYTNTFTYVATPVF